MFSCQILCSFQIVKAYLRRGTAREMLGYYKEAVEGKCCLFPLAPDNLYLRNSALLVQVNELCYT
jgi:hypothetical protein